MAQEKIKQTSYGKCTLHRRKCSQEFSFPPSSTRGAEFHFNDAKMLSILSFEGLTQQKEESALHCFI